VLVRLGQEVQALPRRLTRFVVLLLLALAGFAVLAVGYEREPLASVDADVAEWVASSMPTMVEWLARPPSWLGGWIGLTVLGLVLGVVLIRERAWVDVGFVIATFAGSQVVVALLKGWFDRARPDVGSAVDLPSSAAFPSGHATAGVASLGAAAVLIAERLPSRRARVWLWSAVVAAGVAVGLSRIALNVHYVTDVLAGWCLGLAWLAACLIVRESALGESEASSRPRTRVP
jgi:membrane-associated phospholipid phosphatase